jgi:hypothetical protein
MCYPVIKIFGVKNDLALQKLDNDNDPTQGPGNSNHVEKLSIGDMTQTDYLDKLTETPDVTDIETGTCVLQ